MTGRRTPTVTGERRRASAYVPPARTAGVATISDPEELWRAVMKWSLAAFIGTIVVLLVVLVLAG